MERRLRLLGAVGKFHHRMCKKHLCLGMILLGDLQEKAPVRVLFQRNKSLAGFVKFAA